MNCVLFGSSFQMKKKEQIKQYWKMKKKYWKFQGILSVRKCEKRETYVTGILLLH